MTERGYVFSVLADDLSGALDAVGGLPAWGLSTEVTFDAAPGKGIDAVGVTTESRHAEPAEVVARTARAASLHPGRVTYLKLDSTLRGQPGAALRGLAEARPGCAPIVVLAYPELGRTVVEGRVRVDGEPFEESAFAAEVSTGSVAERLELAAEDVIYAERPEDLEGLPSDRTVIVNATERGSLDRWAEYAAARLSEHLLVGSGGWLRSLPAALGLERAAQAPRPVRSRRGTTIIIVGSRHPAARAQAEALRAEGLVEEVPYDPEDPDASERRLRRLGRHLEGERVCLIDLSSSAFCPGRERRVAERLGRAVAHFPRERLGSLFLTGGDTAAAVLRAAGAKGLQVVGEAPGGIVTGTLRSGGYGGIVCAVKPGGFGLAEAIQRWLES